MTDFRIVLLYVLLGVGVPLAMLVAQSRECVSQQRHWQSTGKWRAYNNPTPADIPAQGGANTAKMVCEWMGYEYR